MERTEVNKYLQAQLKDGIVTVEYQPDVWLGLDDARWIVDSRLNFFGDLKFPVLIKSEHIRGIDQSACRYFLMEGMINFTAIAILELNTVERLLTNLLFDLYPQKIPHKVFSDEQKARIWLTQYL